MKIKQVVSLNKEGEAIDTFQQGKIKKNYLSSEIFPIMVEDYVWDQKRQERSAEKYKDQIKRVFYQDKVDEKIKIMLQDDIRRLELIKDFDYGKNILEVGCSDGSASIKIAENPKVKKVFGIDIRKSAINDGEKLIKDLLKRREIDKKIADKIRLGNYTVENFPLKFGKFDSVCAYEIFEHMAPQNMLPAFQHLYKFIKKDGNFFISVPNRFPDEKYDRMGRTRWKWFDHRNFFSQASLELFLRNFFKKVDFFPLYENEKAEKSIYLICECRGKLYEN
ncbi:MAG: class I SAM-dependent methyltransferase [Parcubacteria group bacterium]|jgi:SAM-dependent methyltransferase